VAGRDPYRSQRTVVSITAATDSQNTLHTDQDRQMPRYHTVLRMPASFYIPLGTRLQLNSEGKLIRYFSEAAELGGQPVPRELAAEVSSNASSLTEALG